MATTIAEPVTLNPIDEASFRRGYRAGWIAALLTVEEMVTSEMHDALAAHAHSGPLAIWAEADDCTDQTPPPVCIGGITYGSNQ